MGGVKSRVVPQIKGLRVEDFMNFVENEIEVGIDYLSENYKKITLNKQWFANLCRQMLINISRQYFLMKKNSKKW